MVPSERESTFSNVATRTRQVPFTFVISNLPFSCFCKFSFALDKFRNAAHAVYSKIAQRLGSLPKALATSSYLRNESSFGCCELATKHSVLLN